MLLRHAPINRVMIDKSHKRLALVLLRVDLGDIAKILKIFSQMIIAQIAN